MNSPANVKALRVRYKAGWEGSYLNGPLHALTDQARDATVTARRVTGIGGAAIEDNADSAWHSSRFGNHLRAQEYHLYTGQRHNIHANDLSARGDRVHAGFHREAATLHYQAAAQHRRVHAAVETGARLGFRAENGDEYTALADFLEERGYENHAIALRQAVFPRKES